MVRIKHRYLLLNILYPDDKLARSNPSAPSSDDVPYTVQFRQPSPPNLDGKILTRVIRDGVATFFGDYGSGMIAGSLQLKYFSPATSTAIVRVAREHYRLVWAALTLTTRLPRPVDRPCVIQVVRVSGTIKKAEEEAIRRARAAIKRAREADLRAGVHGEIVASLSEGARRSRDGDRDDQINGIEDFEDEDAGDDGGD